VAVLLVVAGVRGATSAGTTFHNFPGRFVTMWVANVQTTAAEIRRTGRPFTVFDAKPPLYFAQLNFPDTNRLSVMLGTGYAHFTYDKPGLPSYFVDPIGRLVRGDLSVQGRWKPQQGTVECWTGLKVLTLSHAAKDDSLFLRLRTDQPAPVQVRISVRAPGTQDAFANDTDGLINIPAGRSDLLIPMRPTLATAVLVNTDGPAVCINGVQLGAPAPLTTD
jgi:hypothetical protein